ncbi:DUF4242 domain-containing protein [Arenibacter sp. 6A1]|uniref:nickel-binding protein n=1 Tax=Arenibacter sp. 6A1 TaxID=2720391 RepID=UPI001448829A|nr:nickel-binding protein [Arenibacter sp. 6A1]NKI25562.1 DUF4242 domain-containing protein [Arenibacter sp. 6A1]
MPVFMDLHVGQGVTAEQVAIAHQKDLAAQEKYNCKCLTYWVDEERGNAYCLIEAPNKEAVAKLHYNAHKQLPAEIIEVDTRVVKAFLGRLQDPEIIDYVIDQKIKVFTGPAFRVILHLETNDVIQLSHQEGGAFSGSCLHNCNEIMHGCIAKYQGVVADHKGEALIASFQTAMQAVLCASEIKNVLKDQSDRIKLRISIHGGIPVDNNQELFGNTLRLAGILNGTSKNGSIVISATVKQLLDKADRNAGINFAEVHCLSAANEEFLTNLGAVFSEHWQNSDFKILECCKFMGVSTSQLYRKSVEATGSSAKALLLEFRLKKARQMLFSPVKNISQIAYDSGFNSPSYFSKCFHKRFGLQPTSYLKPNI